MYAGDVEQRIFLNEYATNIYLCPLRYLMNHLALKLQILFRPLLRGCLIFAALNALPIIGRAQPDCTITSDHPMPVCKGTQFQLSAIQAPGCVYSWSVSTSSSPIIALQATINQTVTLTVTDTVNQLSCTSQPFEIEVYPSVQIQFEQMQLTCSNSDNDNGQTAMVRASATGQSGPYTYQWDVRPTQIAPGNPSLAIGLKAHQRYAIKVTDQNNCIVRDTFFTRAYPNPVIEVFSNPDTAFIQKPYVNFEYVNKSADSIRVTSQYWEMGDESQRVELEKPMHTYTEIGDYKVVLTVYNSFGCDTVYFKDVKVMPIKLSIPNIITPNNDGINDVLVITEGSTDKPTDGLKSGASLQEGGVRPLSAYYKKTALTIFNRQGRIMYESTDYNNDWGGKGLSDGIYFYVLKCEGFKSNDVYKGSITIFGSGN